MARLAHLNTEYYPGRLMSLHPCKLGMNQDCDGMDEACPGRGCQGPQRRIDTALHLVVSQLGHPMIHVKE